MGDEGVKKGVGLKDWALALAGSGGRAWSGRGEEGGREREERGEDQLGHALSSLSSLAVRSARWSILESKKRAGRCRASA